MSLRRKLTLGGAALSLLPLALAQQPASAATAGDIEVTITVKSVSFPELNDCAFGKQPSCSTAELMDPGPRFVFCADDVKKKYGYEHCLDDLNDEDRAYEAYAEGLPHVVHEGDSFAGSQLGLVEDTVFGHIPRTSGVIYLKPGERLRLYSDVGDLEHSPFSLHDDISVGGQVIDLPINDTVGHYTYLSAPDDDGRTRIEYEVKAHKLRSMPRPS